MKPKKPIGLFVSLFLLLGLPGLTLATVEDDIRGLTERVEDLEKKTDISIGGALRVGYNYKDWDEESKDRGGDFDFDTFRLNIDGTVGDMIISAEYRFYPQSDWNAPHHGWFGYDFTENLQGQLGIHQVPFGLQPYASHNFWFSGAYYIGLEDDYDLGLKLLYDRGPWDFALAFYKNDELGNPGEAGRYSVDLIDNADGGYAGAQAAGNEETNQVNARLAHTLDHGDLGATEIGLSGEWGQIYNDNTNDKGDHWASAVHLNGDYGNWNVQLEYAAYEFDPENPDTVNLGTEANPNIINIDDDIITMGAYAFSWGVPAEGTFGIANIAYTLPVDWGPIDSLTFYSDNTVIEPEEDRFDTIWQNVVGCLVASGPLYTYVDVISGENMIFMAGNMVGDDNISNGRNTRLNINFGYYF